MVLATLILILFSTSCSTTQNRVAHEQEQEQERELPPYDRSEWSYPTRIEGCQDTRASLLKKKKYSARHLYKEKRRS